LSGFDVSCASLLTCVLWIGVVISTVSALLAVLACHDAIIVFAVPAIAVLTVNIFVVIVVLHFS
jgi:hypothetical protein